MPYEKRQLKPGPKRVGRLSYLRPPPAPPVQKTFRADPAFIERVEERAMEETLRLGASVRFSDLVRRGLEMVLASPLPGRPARARRCNLVPGAAGGTVCLECRRVSVGGTVYCHDLDEEVKR